MTTSGGIGGLPPAPAIFCAFDCCSGGGGGGAVEGGLAEDTLVSVDSDYEPNAIEQYIFVDTDTTAITITLPAVHTAGRQIAVKDKTGNAAVNNITVESADGDTIDESLQDVIVTNYGYGQYTSDGVNWIITGLIA